MPAASADAKGKNKGGCTGGKSQGKAQNSFPNKTWQREGSDNANKSHDHHEAEGMTKSQTDLENESQILKARLLGSSMCKKDVVDLDAEDDRQKELEQKKVERSARFGSSDGAHAKSSVAMKRQSSQGNVTGTTLSTSSAPASDASPSTQPPARAPYAAPPPPSSAGSAVGIKSSDGARNKAGSSSMQMNPPPPKPRGTVGATISSASTPLATSSTQAAPMQVDAVPSSQTPVEKATQPSVSAVAAPALEPLSKMQLSPEHSAEKAAFDALTVSVQSACLKRALESFTEGARKRPRLAAGESIEWEAEYKSLLDWMDANLPTERYHSKVGGVQVACSHERLLELERCWQQLV